MAVDEAGCFWWHSIELPDGTVTPGEKSVDHLRGEWGRMRLPDLAGLSVLDIGAWDGWFSFQAEQAGANRVVALDSFTWSLDFSRAVGRMRPAITSANYIHAGGDLRAVVVGRVQSHAEIASDDRGSPDAVIADDLFLGVLYHLEDPMRAARRLRAVTRELAVIETHAIALPELQDKALFEFVPGSDVNHDPTNWWFATEKALHGLLNSVGFGSVETVGTDAVPQSRPGITDYRLTVHARP